ncbi:MAG: hypothetical protein ACLU0O_02295 [Collinsella sp.]
MPATATPVSPHRASAATTRAPTLRRGARLLAPNHYIPPDGLRTLAVVAVVLYHLTHVGAGRPAWRRSSLCFQAI